MRKFSRTPQKAPASAGAAVVSAGVGVGVKKQKRQPIFRIVKRNASSICYNTFIRLCAIGFALLVILLFLNGVTGYSFNRIGELLFKGAFSTEFSVNSWLNSTVMLLIISVALAPAFKMKFWNIGAQGQVLMGALLASVVMWYFAEKITYSGSVFLMLLLGFLAGGIWALIPAFCKAKFGTNETLFTLMMNYIAIQLVACTVRIWQGDKTSLGFFNPSSEAGWLAPLFGNPYGAIILIAAIVVVFMAIYLNRTKHGFEISVVGDSPNTAKYAGMNTAKIVMRTVFLSGAICGLVGMLYVSGVNHTLSSNTGGSYGFTAIIVAWTAKFNPVVMVIVSMAIALFERGAVSINGSTTTLNNYTSYILIGILLFFLIGCEFFVNYKIVPSEKISKAYGKFRDKLEQKAPWLVHGCASCAHALHNASAAVEKFFTSIENKVKVFGSKLSRATLDKTVDIVEKCVFRIALRGDKFKTAVYEKPDNCSSAIVAAESDRDADVKKSVESEGEEEVRND